MASEIEKEEIRRPDIEPFNGIRKIMLCLLFFGVLFLILRYWNISIFYSLPVIGLFIFFNAKRTVIWLVLLYQKYAPVKVRAACLFTPSCSEYMILAIQKYGLLKGLIKGIGRLLRCHSPNGGEDYP